jgi:putative membrane protein
MMEIPSPKRANPNDYLANERTFLAWIRTAIAIMAFGFVVVKFGLFLAQLAFMAEDTIKLPTSAHSGIIGIALVALGTTMSVLAFVRYRRVERELNENRFQSNSVLSLLLTCCIVFVGILLVLYLGV